MDRSDAIQRGFISELEKLGFLEGVDFSSIGAGLKGVGENIKGIADSTWGGVKSFGHNMLHDTGADAHISASAADPIAAAKLTPGVGVANGVVKSSFPLISPALYGMMYGGSMLAKPGMSRAGGFGRGLIGGLGIGGLTHGLNLLASGATAINPMASLPILGLGALMGGVAGFTKANKYQNELALAKIKAGQLPPNPVR
ncbi:MAG: hypothetical protein EBU84_00395 [Actinobacteria bacterium]|nr:hypothetical protein [Actinomycetota bacterium]